MKEDQEALAQAKREAYFDLMKKRGVKPSAKSVTPKPKGGPPPGWQLPSRRNRLPKNVQIERKVAKYIMTQKERGIEVDRVVLSTEAHKALGYPESFRELPVWVFDV